MKNYKVKLTPIAQKQFEQMVLYYQEDLSSPDTATKYFNLIKNQIESLANVPERFPEIEEQVDPSIVLRKMVVKNYNIYYSVDKENFSVYIVAILYSKREQLTALRDTIS